MRIGGVDWRRGAPRWWIAWVLGTAGLSGLCCLGLIFQNAVEGYEDLTLILLLALFSAGVSWLICGLVGLIAYGNGRLSLVAPLLVVCAVGLVWTGLPEDLGWRLSKGSLERAAADCVVSDADARYGVYTITKVEQYRGGCLFETRGLLSLSGYAYMPNGAPESQGEYEYKFRPYDGVWFRYWVF
ncbi:hypothetical protein [Nocardia sp. bgisy134]|uniref:hypothetical protein n=1 Tax=Nocardia sp. bgisy134 TaxID=3413789 RepID=UPI003D71923F